MYTNISKIYYIYIYIYIYISVPMYIYFNLFICIYIERKRKGRERERERNRVRVCVRVSFNLFNVALSYIFKVFTCHHPCQINFGNLLVESVQNRVFPDHY